jgi:hypothetical protein
MSWFAKFIGWMTQRPKSDPGLHGTPPLVQDEEPTARKPETIYVKIDFRQELIREAEKWVGVKEVGGNNKGPDVERFQKAVDGKAEGEPWCAAFVQFCIREVEVNFKPTVVSFRSEHCMTIWNKTPGVHRYGSPKPGFLVIWNYVGTASGHIGIVRRVIDEFTIETIEGNTAPDDNRIEREGDGVYRKIRTTKTVGKMKLVGFIAPFNPDQVERPQVNPS